MQHALKRSIEIALLARCARTNGSVCPSDVAREIHDEYWEAIMPQVRDVIAELAEQGRVVVTQRGQPVDMLTARGPVRVSVPRTADRRD